MTDPTVTPGSLLSQIKPEKENALPPIHSWNPPFCGDMDMVIRRDGSWHYLRSPIGRERMVRLFSTILRRDDDDCYYLVTPVEKVRITVEDVPFIATTVNEATNDNNESLLTFKTNVGDDIILRKGWDFNVSFHPETEEPAPYIHVRDRLYARLHRNVFYHLMDRAVVEQVNGVDCFGVNSDGQFFVIGPVPEE